MDRTTRPLSPSGRALVFNTCLVVGRRRRRTYYCYRPFGPDATLVDPWSEPPRVCLVVRAEMSHVVGDIFDFFPR